MIAVIRSILFALIFYPGSVIVVGIAALMQIVGLSMALGAFLAGVLLAESEYRRELDRF